MKSPLLGEIYRLFETANQDCLAALNREAFFLCRQPTNLAATAARRPHCSDYNAGRYFIRRRRNPPNELSLRSENPAINRQKRAIRRLTPTSPGLLYRRNCVIRKFIANSLFCLFADHTGFFELFISNVADGSSEVGPQGQGLSNQLCELGSHQTLRTIGRIR